MANYGESPSPVHAIEQEYRYQPRWTTIIFCGLFFGAGAAFMAYLAIMEDRRVIVLWTVAGLCAGFVLLAAVLAAVRLLLRQRIVITGQALIVPAGRLTRAERAIPYAAIRDLSLTAVGRERFLAIAHEGGKLTLAASLLPHNEDFDTVCGIIAERVAASRQEDRSASDQSSVEDLIGDVARGKRAEVSGEELNAALQREIARRPPGLRLPSKGGRFQAVRDLDVRVRTAFMAPRSSGCRGVLPAGEVLALDYDPDPTSTTGVWLRPERYRALESVLVEKALRDEPSYDGYSISMSYEQLDKDFEWL
jgi:hypothetical protein